MTDIEQKVVQLRVDRDDPGIKKILSDLADLKTALNLSGATKGLDDVNAAAGRISMEEPKKQVSGLLGQFSALQIAAITALTNIVNKAVNAGEQIAKSLSIAPIVSGFQEYETNLNAIQTILANTGLKGADGLAKVNTALGQLNTYSDQTIYNFSEMARNIGTFTAAGVNLDTATAAIKGIANLAAVSGSNAEQASTAMYQLSQALSAGKVTLQDWNSVVNAGMGGEVFRNSLLETARVHGVAVDDIIKKEGSFRDSLQTGWLTSGILTETLSKFTGELTKDQLKSMGYNDKQIAGILEMGKTATDAATKVKTMSQLLDTLREAVGSGWSQTWQIVFGDFDEAKDLFTGVNNTLSGMIQNSAKARNELLQGWKDLGGRQALIDGIKNAFDALLSILRPIRDAFREIFPATTAKQLFDMTVAFRDFMAKLKLGDETAQNLKRTFAGFFAILGIGWDLIKAGAKFIFDLVGRFTEGSGGILKFTGNIGDFLVALHNAIEQGQGFTKFFDLLAKIIDIPLKLLHNFGTVVGHLFNSVDTSVAVSAINNVTSSLNPLGDTTLTIQRVWDHLLQTLDNIRDRMAPVVEKIKSFFKQLGTAIHDAFSGISFDDVLSGVQTGLFAGLILLLKKFVDKFKGVKLDGGIVDKLKEALEGLTGALKGMQNALNATALLAIAAAVGILTLSFIALSKIDAGGLARASTAIGIMMAQLGTAFVAFGKFSTGSKAVRVTVMAAGLILLATAVRVLASSVKELAGLKTEDLLKGLLAVSVLLGTLVASTNRLNTFAPGIIRTSAALVILAGALRLMVLSVQALGGMDWITLAKGITGIGALLTSLVLFSKFVEADKMGVLNGAGIILLATGLKVLASAVGDFDKFNWEQIARGMAGIAVGLGIMVAAINLLPSGSVFKAAGVVIVASSLQLLADGVKKMSGLQWIEIGKGMTVLAGGLGIIAGALNLLPTGTLLKAAGILVVAASLSLIQKVLGNMAGMSWTEIAKGLTTLAGSLIVMAGALRTIQGSIGGAAAITVLAIALNLFVPVLKSLGAMPVGDIVKGLAALAGIFLVVGAAGLALAPMTPIIFALGVGIGLLGLAVLAAGVGVLAFALALKVLGDAGIDATEAIVGIVKGLVGLIPQVIEEIGKGLILFAKVIAESGPAILAAMETILGAFLQTIIDSTPKIVETFEKILEGILKVVVDETPKIIDAGFKVVIAFLKGIADNIGVIVAQGIAIVVNFLEGIAKGLPGLIKAGIDVVIAFINGIGDGMRDKGPELVQAGINMASGIVEGLIRGLKQQTDKALAAVNQLGGKIIGGALSVFGIHSPSTVFWDMGLMNMLGLANGFVDNAHHVTNAASKVGNTAVEAVTDALSGISKALGDNIVEFQPTITPVLDLTDIKKNASSIADLLALPPLDVSGSHSLAQQTARTFNESQNSSAQGSGGNTTYVDFTQNNTSPKPIDDVTIYRQTNNAISKLKKVGDSANQS